MEADNADMIETDCLNHSNGPVTMMLGSFFFSFLSHFPIFFTQAILNNRPLVASELSVVP